MLKLTVNGKTVDVPAGKRLVLAIEEEAGINIGHRCGGYARCTTCRVEFEAGEPEVMTEAEYNKLTERDLFGQVRLSCQIECDREMRVRPVMTLESEGWNDTGPPPEETVTPEAIWYPLDILESFEE
jgi:ferredoxin